MPSPSPRTPIFIALTALLALGGVLLTGGVADAHGELERSEPTANAVLTRAPDEIVLHISEAPDPLFSEIEVFNKDGLRVDTGETVLRDATSLAVGLEPLDPGTYTVTWQATIVSDAHRTTGSFRFTVTGGAAAQALTDTTPTVTNTLTRWGELLGMALVAGTIGTLVTVWRPVFPSVSRETRVRVGRRFRLLAFAGLAVVAVALVVDLLDAANAGTSGGTGIGEALSDCDDGSGPSRLGPDP